MKVSLSLLKRAYLTLQEKDENSDDGDLLNPEDHLHFIDAYEMPQWHWSSERNTFERYGVSLRRFLVLTLRVFKGPKNPLAYLEVQIHA